MDTQYFRLIGRTNVFRLTRRFRHAAGMPCVTGETLDGKFITTARLADVQFITINPQEKE